MSEYEVIGDKRYGKAHLESIKKKADPRYKPELHVRLPITEIFEGIGRTTSFYHSIRKKHGEMLRAFERINPTCTDKELQDQYDLLKKDVVRLCSITETIKEFNTEPIDWGKVKEISITVRKHVWGMYSLLRQAQEEAGDKRIFVTDKSNYKSFPSGQFTEAIQYFRDLSSSEKARLSNEPFLLLYGKAGTGKTHLLCDLVEQRVKSGTGTSPALLVFGEYFSEGKGFWEQTLEQLHVKGSINNKDAFLKSLDSLGEKAKCRSLFIIDALNENISQSPNYWKQNLESIVQDIKNYPHIAFVISVRSGFEDNVMTKPQQDLFIKKEHIGFQFKEEWEAVDKFFSEFSLPLPKIPLLMPKFQNPLFLLLFCKALKKRKTRRNKQTFRGHEGATYIFESFSMNAAEIIAERFLINKGRHRSPEYRIWNEIIKEIASEMVRRNKDKISEECLNDIIKSAYPHVNVGKFVQALESNMLITKVPRYKQSERSEGLDIRFPFQKFSDHLIGRYIFKQYEDECGEYQKNVDTAKSFFSRRKQFILKEGNNGIVEALSIQCPERLKGTEFIQVAPYLLEEVGTARSAEYAFIESLVWRSPKKAFSSDLKNTLDIIKDRIIPDTGNYYRLLNAFLSVSPVPNHPLNANYLNGCLSKFTMPNRDSWWSVFLNDQYGKHGAVDRLLQWAWSDKKRDISDESLFLLSVTLAWFLTTPNRYVRDKATKGLVCVLQDKLDLLTKLLKQFKDVNDPYVSERLYAVAYGCVLRNINDREGLCVLAKWIYKQIFSNNKPPEHILLRDYARGVVEVALKRGVQLKVNQKNLNPPYQSKWPKIISSEKTLEKKYGSEESGYYEIWNSVIGSNSMVGSDFARYVIESRVYRNWSRRKLGVQEPNKDFPEKLDPKIAQRWIFNRVVKLGYSPELHNAFDKRIDCDNRWRAAHKAERIGKKYQWIAYHEFLALVSDHYKLRKKDDNGNENYLGAWNPYVRDIDPTFIMKNDTCIRKSFQRKFDNGHYNAWGEDMSDAEWIKDENDLPKPENIIQMVDDAGNEWLMLEGLMMWDEPTLEYKECRIPMRKLYYMVKGYIVRKTDKACFFTWAKKQNFMERWMPESHEFYKIFLGEYPNSIAFDDFGGNDNTWITPGNNDRRLNVPVTVASDIYFNEFTSGSLDCSHDNRIASVYLPCKLLMNGMKLRNCSCDGRYFDQKGNLIAFSNSVFQNSYPYSKMLLINKKALQLYLQQSDYDIVWTVLGEKNITGSCSGRLEINGAYELTSKGKISGTKHAEAKYMKEQRR